MATAPTHPTLPNLDDDLSSEQWWALFDKLRQAQQQAYAEQGGAVACIRHERDTSNE